MSVPAERMAFELLRFRAAPVTADVLIVEIEGRFPRGGGRFDRPAPLVLDVPATGSVELAPIHEDRGEDGRWRATYALDAAQAARGRFALGVRGALHELPAPDLVHDADRLVAMARETNRARHALTRSEQEARVARAEAQAAEAEAEQLRRELGEAHTETAAARQEGAVLRDEAVAAREEAAAAAQSLAAAREETAAAQLALAEAHEEIARAQLAQAVAREEIAVAREEAADAREETAAAREELAAVREELAAASDERSVLEADLEAARASELAARRAARAAAPAPAADPPTVVTAAAASAGPPREARAARAGGDPAAIPAAELERVARAITGEEIRPAPSRAASEARVAAAARHGSLLGTSAPARRIDTAGYGTGIRAPEPRPVLHWIAVAALALVVAALVVLLSYL